MPIRPSNGTSPSPPPATKASISTVSEWAKELARNRSGMRSWIEASTASLAIPLAIAATRQSRATISSENWMTASTATPATMIMLLDWMAVGRWMRSRVPMAVARKVPTASAPPTTPNAHSAPRSRPNTTVVRSPFLIAKARKSSRKP